MDHRTQETLRSALLEAQAQWRKRLGAIQADRRRVSAPLERDLEDQATQRENDETLDALDRRGREELEAIGLALARIESGQYGRCARCGEALDPSRLRANPTAQCCLECAS